jgi:murein DD-endopeptidase MepM/ murein hydrolase activator NlpD
VPFTLIPDRPRIDIITHTVQAGDTLYAIADQFGVSAETLMWANNMELNPDLLRLGQELTVLPVNGVYHTVEKNDTVESIAKKYKVASSEVIAFPLNGLNPKNPSLQVGQRIVVPGGTKPAVVRQVQVYSGPIPEKASRGTGRFVWPTSGNITQAFKPLHQAIDIGSYTGAPVKASDSGYIVASGWSNLGYGNYVVVDHGNGFQTLYGHLTRYFVNAGDSIAQGTVLGLVGSTGNSTGPHLHFELRQNGINRNPFGFLP